jgi:hypothetical protein
MKGLYITEEGRRGIEGKIANLEKQIERNRRHESRFFRLSGKKLVLKEILSTATILPVDDSWVKVPMGTNECELSLPNGVIIEAKE